jgi:hypothetical protein
VTSRPPVVRWQPPKGRSAAEQRLAAIAALHAPFSKDQGALVRDGMTIDFGRKVICQECSDRYEEARWPCATARLVGPWPGEVTEAVTDG